MKTLDKKLIVYDSNCKVCSSMREVILALTRLDQSKIVALKDLSLSTMAQIDFAKFKNAMALVDTEGGETLYGAEGIAYVFATQCRLAGILLSSRPVFRLFRFLYNVLAYNRYIIATPKSGVNCDCFPDRIIVYRLSYILITLLLSVFLSMIFGSTLAEFFPGHSRWRAASGTILIACSGWCIQIVLAFLVMKKNALEYIGHLGSIMVAGLLILMPWVIFHILTGSLLAFLPIASVAVSSSVILYLHIHRVRYLGMSPLWTITWFTLLQTLAVWWIYFFERL